MQEIFNAPLVPRNRSLNFGDHVGLVHKYARLFYGRLVQSHHEADYDDVFGELTLAFVKAARGYKQDLGWTFTAFLTRCMVTHFNKYARRLLLEQYGSADMTHSVMGLRSVSVHSMGFEGDPYESFEDANVDAPDARLSAQQSFKSMLADKSLRPETRVYLSMLVDPGMQISDAARDRIRDAAPLIKEQIERKWGVHMEKICI